MIARFSGHKAPFIAVALALTGLLSTSTTLAADSDTQSDTADWLYAGSDIPRDKAWTFGALPNGLRYAVRNNGSPPGQVSIRVRIGAGSLMEADSERGFAHFIEHLSFRGSRYMDDGETKRTWQRLGVAFGSDTNASTTPTSTVYKLDLPAATTASLEETMKVLSWTIQSPNLDAQTVASERGVVLSELRESEGPQGRVGDAIMGHVFSGQLLADRIPIGTVASLNAARAETLAAFHERWYRPDNTVIAIAGDLPPEQLAAMVEKYFGSWKSEGKLPAEPDFGDPIAGLPVASVIHEPTQPNLVMISYLRPWRRVTDSIAYTQSLYHEFIALRIIGRRLEERARDGGSYILANVSEEKISRSAKVTSINLVPSDDWQSALTDVRSIIADALERSPSQQEIDREYAEFDVLMLREVENARNEPGSELVDDLINAVDIGEVVSDIADHLELMRSSRPLATPEYMLQLTRELFSADVVRAFISSSDPVPADAMQELARIATTDVAPDRTARVIPRAVTMADVPSIGKAGTVLTRETLPVLGMKRLELDNGVTALIYDNTIEPDKIRVRVRFGGGYQAVSPSQPNLLWAGDLALVESGIGSLNMRDLETLTTGRLLSLQFGVDDAAFEFNAETNSADVEDQLKLIASKVNSPGWDPAPVRRARIVELAGYDAATASPADVLRRSLEDMLRPGDARFDAPSREQVDQLTPEAFRAFWEPLLKRGPIEVMMFGDLSKVDEEAILARTFGALQPRKTPKEESSASLPFPDANEAPYVLRHSGEAGQSAAIVAWNTGGGVADMREARQLDVLAAIFNDRLFDRLRSAEGASYSPSVGSSWPKDFSDGGYLMAAGLVTPDDVDTFYGHVRDIAAELVAQPVSYDELRRAVTPLREYVYRASSGNVFYMNELEGVTRDPRRLNVLRSYIADMTATNPADIQRLAKAYLSDDGFSLLVLPEGVELSSVWSPYTPSSAATAKAANSAQTTVPTR